MYFIRRALKYLKKKKGKTILLGIIFIVIANFVLAGMLVQNATTKAQEETRIKIGADVNYIVDIEGIFEAVDRGAINFDQMGGIRGAMGQGITISEDFTSEGAPTYSNFLKAIDSKYVKSFDANITYDMTISGLKAYSLVDGSDTHNFNAKLYMTNEMNDFIDENGELTDGRYATDEEMEAGANVILIEKNIADLNSLKLGDKVTIKTQVHTYDEVDIEYEIIGIYETFEEVDQRFARQLGESLLPQNRIYIPFNNIKKIGFTSDDLNNLLLTSIVISLNDPLNVDSYREETEPKFNLKLGTFDANDDLFKSLIGPLKTLGYISNILVIIIAIAGALIIGLITALSINERKEEIGILLAVGESKLKIVSQLVLEVVIIAVITFSLSTLTGSIIGKTISDKVLDSGILETEQSGINMFSGGRINIGRIAGSGGGGLFSQQQPTIEKKESVDISLDATVMLQLIGLGILMAMFSTVIPSLHVMRFNPKQILTNRNS